MDSLARPSPALVVAIVALIVAITGVGVAAIPNKTTGAITGCFHSKSGVLRVIDEKKKCKRGEKRIAWNQSGQTGTTGPQGTQGAPGTPGTDAQFNGAAAGGDLTGQYPSPQLGPNSVGVAEIGPDAVGASEVGPDTLTGSDIDENTLLGINAATLGGSAPSAFAATGHNHDATYVNEGQGNSVNSAMLVDETVTTGDIDDKTRAISFPMSSFTDCDGGTGAFLSFTDASDAKPHFVNSSLDPVKLLFDAAATPDEDYAVCTSFMVPPDYVSGSTVRVRQNKSIDNSVLTANLETLTCHLTVGSGDGGPGTVTLPGASNTSTGFLRSCNAPIPGGDLDPGDPAGISIQITATGTVDDPVEILSVEWRYTADS